MMHGQKNIKKTLKYLLSLLQNRLCEVTAVNYTWGISVIQFKRYNKNGPFYK